MPRQDVPYGGAICRLKERIAEIWDKLGEKLHSINGVEGDAAGNVQIVSGDAAVVVTSDQVNHEIEIALDSSQLPSAAVQSVNGQTGAVALDAGDIPTVGGDVQADLQDLANDISGNTAAINAEALARANADSALQANINTANAAIALKVGGSGNIGSDTKPIKIVNGDAVAVTDDLQTSQDVQDALDAYLSMVRTTGNQTISGEKAFNRISYFPIAHFSKSFSGTTTNCVKIFSANIRVFEGIDFKINVVRLSYIKAKIIIGSNLNTISCACESPTGLTDYVIIGHNSNTNTIDVYLKCIANQPINGWLENAIQYSLGYIPMSDFTPVHGGAEIAISSLSYDQIITSTAWN